MMSNMVSTIFSDFRLISSIFDLKLTVYSSVHSLEDWEGEHLPIGFEVKIDPM